MATYAELVDQGFPNVLLKKKVFVACLVAAEKIGAENVATTNHTNRLIWAAKVFSNPQYEADRMLWALLAKFNTAPIATILNTSDTDVQTNVEIEVNLFAQG